MSYDLLLSEGHVIDPSQGIDRVLDIAIAGGRIVELGADLGPRQAAECRNLQGKYVCPGLIDLHGHWYQGSAFGIDPHYCLNTGVTTAVDAGTAGFINFPEFRRNCIDRAELQVLAFINISCLGLPTPIVGELEDIRYARPVETAAVLDRNRDVAVGVKIREGAPSKGNWIEALELAITAASKNRLPLMVHISPSAPTPEIVRRLRPGDIVTHCFQGRGDGLFPKPELSLLLEASEARRRGVVFDIGHGCGSFQWEIAQRAFEYSFYPDTISTDLHRYSVEGPVYDMPTTMSKFLCLGMSLQDVILKSTLAPARSIGRDRDIGTLRPGTAADIFVFELASGEFEFVDTHFNARKGDTKLVPHLTIKNGRVILPGTYDIKLRPYELCDYDVERSLKESA